MKFAFFACTLIAFVTNQLASSAQAALVITEVMSTSGATDVLAGLDWWELTNNDTTAVSLAGYQWEDNNPTGFNMDTAIFPNLMIAGGQSVIIHQGDNTAGTLDSAFRAAWNLSSTVQVLFQNQFTGNNLFSGLGSGGDEVNVYSNSGILQDNATFGASTSGQSFSWDAFNNSLGLSASGQNGAITASYGAFGSPGFAAVPEPSSFVLLGLACGPLWLRRRRA